MTALATSPLPAQTGGPPAADRPRAETVCRCFSSFQSISHLRRDWDHLVASSGAPIYHSFDWCAIWWRHYGAGREARIFLFERAGRPIAILPMCIERLRLGPITVRLARFIGSDSTPAVCDPPLDAGRSEVILDQVIERLIGRDRCHVILFGPLADDSPRTAALRAFCHRSSETVVLLRDHVPARYATIPLPAPDDSFERSLSKKQRYSLRKGWELLKGAFDVREETITDPQEALGELDAFTRMHRAQWTQQGRPGHFADWPAAESFNRSLVAALAPAGAVRFHRLIADGQVLTRQYCLLFGDRGHWRLSARVMGPQWDAYGLGRLGLWKMLQGLTIEGLHSVEAGPGRYPYKRRMGAQEHDVRSILLVRRDAAARLKARLTTGLADLLDRAYYRLWYLRIAPHLPWGRRPLINAWIRSRI
jgi:CelD/BcsL family acetyltransferase involved in cellulose biosynthesis